MRIVGGEFRGRRLAQPKNQNIRPSTDRNRESLFNILSHNWPEKLDESHVLDVFAGTGALGCEALSRGAAFATFLELNGEATKLIQQNREVLGILDRSNLIRRDATNPGSKASAKPVDLIFADPPYSKGLGDKAACALAQNGWLTPGALLVLEEQRDAMPVSLKGFEKVNQRQFGETTIAFFDYIAE